MEDTVRARLAEITTQSIVIFPDWDAVIDKSTPFRLHFNAGTDDFGVTLVQEQCDGSIRPIGYTSWVNLTNEQNWTRMELEARCTV